MRKNLFISILTAALLCMMYVPPGAGDPDPVKSRKRTGAPVYSIGIIPFYSPEKIWQLYTPFVHYLNRTTPVKWELKLYPSHDAIINDICSGELSLALLGPVPLGRAYKKCGVEPLLVSLSNEGKPFYQSVIVTNDMKISSLAELRGKTFAFFKGSTAAHIVPAKMLKDEGVTERMIRPVFYESQDSIINALLRNEVTAAGVKESLFRKFKGTSLKIVKVSPALPQFSFCALPAVNPHAKKQFIDALLKLKPLENAGDRAVVKDWDDEIKNGFIVPPETYFQDVLTVNKYYEEIMNEDR